MDFVDALNKAICAPSGRGSGPGAFIDSMIWHDDMNVRKALYTMEIACAGAVAHLVPRYGVGAAPNA